MGKIVEGVNKIHFTMLYGNYCYIFIENFPQKFSPCSWSRNCLARIDHVHSSTGKIIEILSFPYFYYLIYKNFTYKFTCFLIFLFQTNLMVTFTFFLHLDFRKDRNNCNSTNYERILFYKNSFFVLVKRE